MASELEVGQVNINCADSYAAGLRLTRSGTSEHAHIVNKDGALWVNAKSGNSTKFIDGDDNANVHLEIGGSGLATFSGGISNERGIYGGTLSVADDAVGEITPPRQATFMTLSYNATSDYPSHWGGLLYMDVGLSIVSNVVAGPSSAVVGVNSDVTGTTGSDGKTTVGGTLATGSGQIGKIRIENRHGTSVTYNYTFFG